MSMRSLARFTLSLWLTLAAFIGCAASFAWHVAAERQVRASSALREQSLLLAAELRQSSDDLTRMVRTYVATGTRAYRDQYQEILDIRDGRRPRPVGHYQGVYWDLALDGQQIVAPSQPALSLLRRMEHAGFKEEELGKLAN